MTLATKRDEFGTENPERAAGWIMAINSALDMPTWVDVYNLRQRRLAMQRDVIRDQSLLPHLDDFLRCCPLLRNDQCYPAIKHVRDQLIDAFDLPATGRLR